MKKLICYLDAIIMAREFIVKNTSYSQLQFVSEHQTEESYRFEYIVRDLYDREVQLAVYINFANKTISADVVIAKEPMAAYLPK